MADACRIENNFLAVIRSKSAEEGKPKLVNRLYFVKVMDLPEFRDCTKAYPNY